MNKSPLRRILGAIVGRLCALPVLLIHAVGSLVIGRTRSFRATSEAVSLLPGPLGTVVRRYVYRALLARCGSGTSIGFGTVLTYRDTELGESVYVGRFCSLGLTSIGDGTMIGNHVSVISGRHGMDLGQPMREQDVRVERVSIGADSWIASAATVLADVGTGAVVAAGAVVTHPVEPGIVVAGVPARPIRHRE